jgi:endoglucanase
LDQGPAIYTNDSRTLYDHRLIRYLSDLGDRYGIRYQYRQPASGGTDAGAIHTSRSGIPTISLSVPGRYTHTAGSIIRKADWEDHYRLMTVALRHIDADILKENR